MNDISELFAQYNGGDFTADLLQGLGGTAPPRLSLDNDRFTFIDSAGEKTPHTTFTLKVIIIGVNPHGPSKMFWGRSYNKDSNSDERPLCWSDNGIGPSQLCIEPQNITCRDCEFNKWGSAVSNMTGKGIKACQDRKKLAVIIPEHNSKTVWLLNVPPGSFSNLAAYVKTLASHSMNGRQVQLFDIVTELSMSDKELQFKPVGEVTTQAQEQILDLWKAGTVKEIVGANDQPIKALLTAPKKTEAIEFKAAASLPAEPRQQAPREAQQDAPAKRGPGRPRKLADEPEDASRGEAPTEVPAFLRRDAAPSRGGIVAEPEKPKGGLMEALNQAFKLPLG